MYTAPGHGHTAICYKFWQHFKAFIISIILYQFQKDPFCLIIRFFLYYFMHVYSPRASEDNPWGQFFDGSRKVLSIWSLVACFKNIFALWFYVYFFPDFIYVYSPGARADNPFWPKAWSQQKGLITLVICYKFLKKSLQPLILCTFCSWFYSCI